VLHENVTEKYKGNKTTQRDAETKSINAMKIEIPTGILLN
jgi:hypothetical protein